MGLATPSHSISAEKSNPISMSSSMSVRLPIVNYRRRPVSMPLPSRDYSSLSNLIDRDFHGSPPHKTKFQADFFFWTRLAYSFRAISGVVFLYILCHSHFDIARVTFSVSLTIGFLSFVRPVRWLIVAMFRLSMWSFFFLLAFKAQIARRGHYTTMNINLRQTSRYKDSRSGRVLVIQSAIGILALYFLVSEMPIIRVTSFGVEIFRFTFKLLRAIILLQYYIILLSSLELMIYLRVDRILDVMGTAWFRWAVRRAWSVTTWADIIVSSFLSSFVRLG